MRGPGLVSPVGTRFVCGRPDTRVGGRAEAVALWHRSPREGLCTVDPQPGSFCKQFSVGDRKGGGDDWIMRQGVP